MVAVDLPLPVLAVLYNISPKEQGVVWTHKTHAAIAIMASDVNYV